MKLYLKGLLLSGVLFGTACTDLDVDLNNKYPQLPNNPIVVEGEFNAVYRKLHGWFGRDINEGVVNQGDDIMAVCYTQGNYYDDGRAINASIHCLTLDNYNTWILNDIMAACNESSKRISAYGGPTFDDPIVAPVRAIRAFYHFWGMELFGDVPIYDHPVGEGEIVNRQPRAQVAQFIADELEAILAQTKEDGTPALSQANDISTYGKPNYWMACALLAKVYLNWGVYTNPITEVTATTPNPKLDRCVELCDELINCPLFEVGTGYRRSFSPTTACTSRTSSMPSTLTMETSRTVGRHGCVGHITN